MTKNTQNSLGKTYRKYLTRVDNLIAKDAAAAEFFQALKNCSETEIAAIARQEIKVFDEKWIDSITAGLEAIDRIVKDPKKFIKTVGVLTPVELARKTNAESIVHLSSHSQYVKSIDEEGNVVPDKVLNIEAEDDYAIYENRFLKTLIAKLLIFVERRYDYIRKHADTRDTDIIVVKSRLTVGETVFECEQKVKISTPSADDGKREYNRALLDRILEIRKMVHFYAESDLMKKLKEAKPVYAPIQQTNIIRKNKDYNRCYQLFRFLDSYDKLGLAVKVKEAKAEFDEEYLKRLYYQIMFADLAFDSSKSRSVDMSGAPTKKIKPKLNRVLITDPSLDDSRFGSEKTVRSQASSVRDKARLKAQKEKEAARLRKAAQLRREKEKAARLKAAAKAKAEQIKAKEKEKLQQQKAAEKARLKTQKEREQARQKAKALRDQELEKVLQARRKVAAEAKAAKERARQREKERLEKEKAKQSALKKKRREQAAARAKAQNKKNSSSPKNSKKSPVVKTEATLLKQPQKVGDQS